MKMIIANHKMNLSYKEILDYINYFKKYNYFNIYYAPSSLYLNLFVQSDLKTVSQDVSAYDSGAYTGDNAAFQLKSMQVNYCIVGHSERRKYYNDNVLVNQKVKRLLENDIVPILCIGESKEDRQNGDLEKILSSEIDMAFSDLNKDDISKIIIAYEPLWSIGTGIIPSNDDIKKTISFIKKYVNKRYDTNNYVLYGGSVNGNNIEILEKINNIDGYLVGGCSIKKEEFNNLIQKVNR